MSPGTYLTGAALLILIGAYIGSPLRRTKIDIDKVIERWVSDARHRMTNVPALSHAVMDAEQNSLNGEVDVEQVNFCPQCGRRVETDHRFCPGCGVLLPKGAAK